MQSRPTTFRFGLLRTACLLAFCVPFTVAADGPHESPAADVLSANIADMWFSARTNEDLVRTYLGQDVVLSEIGVEQLRRTVLSREIFASAARTEGLNLPDDVVAANPTEETILLALAYEGLLRERVQPSDAQLREIYETNVVAIVAGVANASVPEFDATKEILRENYIQNQMNDHYRTLLIGLSVASQSAFVIGTDLSDIHAGHTMGQEGHSTVGETPQERLAYMTSHFEAGVQLWRDGHADLALGHLSHPVSQMHAAEWEGLDAHGFDQSLFVAAYDSVTDGADAEETNRLIDMAAANLYQTAQLAETSPKATVQFILPIAKEQYELSVQDGEIIDMKIYQDIAGYAKVAEYWLMQLPNQDQAQGDLAQFSMRYRMRDAHGLMSSDEVSERLDRILGQL